MLQIGDRVAIQGNPASSTLSNPAHIYTGTVVGYEDGHVVVGLDEPVEYRQRVRLLPPGPDHYREECFSVQEVSVQTTSCTKLA